MAEKEPTAPNPQPRPEQEYVDEEIIDRNETIIRSTN
jgi:hypothetical protein